MTGDVADDHFHRFPEDIALMKGEREREREREMRGTEGGERLIDIRNGIEELQAIALVVKNISHWPPPGELGGHRALQPGHVSLSLSLSPSLSSFSLVLYLTY